jgi:hypothetical protein
MAATNSVSVTNTAWTAIVAGSHCKDIRVTENRGASGFPNGDFLVCKTPSPDGFSLVQPPASPNTVRIQSGAHYTFPGKFAKGQAVGYIEMVAAVTTTFDVDEGVQQ